MRDKSRSYVNTSSADQPNAGRFCVAAQTSKRCLRFYTLWADSSRPTSSQNINLDMVGGAVLAEKSHPKVALISNRNQLPSQRHLNRIPILFQCRDLIQAYLPTGFEPRNFLGHQLQAGDSRSVGVAKEDHAHRVFLFAPPAT